MRYFSSDDRTIHEFYSFSWQSKNEKFSLNYLWTVSIAWKRKPPLTECLNWMKEYHSVNKLPRKCLTFCIITFDLYSIVFPRRHRAESSSWVYERLILMTRSEVASHLVNNVPNYIKAPSMLFIPPNVTSGLNGTHNIRCSFCAFSIHLGW